jgi:hydrogenase maturation protein HypF
MDHQDTDPASIAFLRRGRGYAPFTINLPCEVKPTLAVGGERKNTFCLAHSDQALISHHVGDMEKEDAHRSFEQGIAHLSHISHIKPEIVAYDLNPDHFSTQYAERLNMTHVAVQHQHAHIVSCMADNHLDDRRVIGLAFDGTGYGIDGALWGGDVLLASFTSFERFAHLEYLPLPGADSATHAPWQTAMAYAHALDLNIQDLPGIRSVDAQVLHLLQHELSEPGGLLLTSSMGCLFDAVACLIGLRNEVTYEAQAAMELETLARPFIALAGPYPYQIDDTNLIRVKDTLNSIIADVQAKRSVELIAARFHRTVADIAVDVCKRARELSGLNEVVVSGGVWQNRILLQLVRDGLKQNGFVMYSHHQVPTNDGGLSLGQAVIANYSCGVQEMAPAATNEKFRS